MTATVGRAAADQVDYGGMPRPGPGSDPARRRLLQRRWRRMALTIAAVLAVIGLAVGVRAITAGRFDSSWQAEISWGMWGPIAPVGEPRTPVSYPAAGSTDPTPPVVVTFTKGGRFTVDLGPTSVEHITITDLEFAGASVVHVESVSMAPALGETLRWSPLRPFDPADRAGSKYLRFTFAFDSCRNYEPGSGITLDAVTITYRGHGRSRHQQVPLPTPISIVIPEGCGG